MQQEFFFSLGPADKVARHVWEVPSSVDSIVGIRTSKWYIGEPAENQVNLGIRRAGFDSRLPHSSSRMPNAPYFTVLATEAWSGRLKARAQCLAMLEMHQGVEETKL